MIVMSLFLKEIPYVNLFSVKYLCLFYLAILLLLLSPFSIKMILTIILIMLFIALIFSLWQFNYLVELLGIAIYFLAWLAAVLEISHFLRREKK